MNSMNSKKRLISRLGIYVLLIVVAALVIGFLGGYYYSNHRNTTDKRQTSPGSVPVVCECPFIPSNYTGSSTGSGPCHCPD